MSDIPDHEMNVLTSPLPTRQNGKAETSQKSAEKELESPKAESPRIDTTLQVWNNPLTS